MWILRRSEGFLAVALVLTSIRAQADPPTPATPGASTLARPSAAPGSPDAPAVPRSPPAPTTTPAASDSVEDPLASYREQFKLGMDRYRRGAMAEAIGYWEPIYRELGEEKGYRLAYDLGVAYQEFGDATRAAERLEAFLREVDARAARHEELAAIVAREEGDAHARLARLLATKGRIRVDAGASPRAVRVDASEPRLSGFIAWVTPGVHRIVLGAGTPAAETRVVSVRAGEVIDVASPVPAAPPPSSAGIEPPPAGPPSDTRSPKAGDAPSDGAAAEAPPTGSASATSAHSAGPFPAVAGAAAPIGSAEALGALVPTRHETHHPFTWPLLLVGGGATLAAALAAIPLYGEVTALHDRLSSQASIAKTDRDRFDSMRTLTYSVTGGAIGLAALTAGLSAWYILGTTEREVTVAPVLSPEHGGASLRINKRF